MSEDQDKSAMGDEPLPGDRAIYAQSSGEGDPPPHDTGSQGGTVSGGEEEGDPPPDSGEESDAPTTGGGTGEGDPPPH